MAQRPARARQLGVEIGALGTGAGNAITDVPGVAVGHTTLSRGADLRTGVTAVVPARVMAAGAQCPAAVAVGNGYGKLVGSTQVAELGVIETPILLTATLSAFRVADALVEYLLARPGYEAVQSINPVVGETNDGFLSDIRARPLRYEHVAAAEPPGNSCVIVVATDAPLDARQLGRVGRRALTGLARTGSDLAGGSGDYAIAFSTARPGGPVTPDADLDPVFRATIDAVEEAILNSLFMAETTAGFRGHVRHAVPHAWVRRARATAMSR
jgi:D-aminopeptidase